MSEVKEHITRVKAHVLDILHERCKSSKAFFLHAARGNKDHALSMEQLKQALIHKGASENVLNAGKGKYFKLLYDSCPKYEGKVRFQGFAKVFYSAPDRAQDERASLPQCSVKSSMMSPRAARLMSDLIKNQEKLRNVGARRLGLEIIAKVQHKALTKTMGGSADVNPDVLRQMLMRYTKGNDGYLDKNAFETAMNDHSCLDMCATKNDLGLVFADWAKDAKGIHVDDFIDRTCELKSKQDKSFYTGHKPLDKGDARAARVQGAVSTLAMIRKSLSEQFRLKRLGPLNVGNFKTVWSRWTGNYTLVDGGIPHVEFVNVVRQDLALSLDAVHPGDLNAIIAQIDPMHYGSLPVDKLMVAIGIPGATKADVSGVDNGPGSPGAAGARPHELGEAIRRKVIYSGMLLPDFWKLININRVQHLQYPLFHNAMLQLNVQPVDKYSTKAMFDICDRGSKGYITFDDFACLFHPSGVRKEFPASKSPDAKPWEKPAMLPYKHGLAANAEEAGGHEGVWTIPIARLTNIIRMKAERKAISQAMGHSGVPNPKILKQLLLRFSQTLPGALTLAEFITAMRTTKGLDVKNITDPDLTNAFAHYGGHNDEGLSIDTFCNRVLPKGMYAAGIARLMTDSSATSTEHADAAMRYSLDAPPFDHSRTEYCSNQWESVAQGTIDASGKQAYKLPKQSIHRRAEHIISSLADIASNKESRATAEKSFPRSESSKLGAGPVFIEATKSFYNRNGGGLYAKRAMSLNARDRPPTTRPKQDTLMKDILSISTEPIVSNFQATHGKTGKMPWPSMVHQKSAYTATSYPEGPLGRHPKQGNTLYNLYGIVPSRPASSTGRSRALSSSRVATPIVPEIKVTEPIKANAETQTRKPVYQEVPSGMEQLQAWRNLRATRARTSAERTRAHNIRRMSPTYRNCRPTLEQQKLALETQREKRREAAKRTAYRRPQTTAGRSSGRMR